MSRQENQTLLAEEVQTSNKLSVGTFPRKYIQGAGAIQRIGSWTSAFDGNKALLLGGHRALAAVGHIVSVALSNSRIELVQETFQGESTEEEIKRFCTLVQDTGADFLIAAGGGKAIDCGKVVAFRSNKPIVTVPTVASTDAPTSTVSVVYGVRGEFSKYVLQPFNPDLVIVDTAVIAKAPFRYLAAGIGGAFGVCYEAPLAAATKAVSVAGGRSLRSAIFLAEHIRDILLRHSQAARLSVARGVVTESLDLVIEAVFLMSGIGFESGGLAAAHSIYHGYRDLNKPNPHLHGELVAFGTIVQLILLNQSWSEIEEALVLFRSIGLPLTFQELGIKTDEVKWIARVACEKGTARNIGFIIDGNDLVGAMHLADEMGQRMKRA